MRTNAVDLDLAGTALRVICDDPAGSAWLRSAMAEHVVDEPAPVGFALRVPAASGKFHVLMDRSGFVLARVRSTDEALAVLGRHLAALLPAPADTLRMRARAFIRADSTVVLAAFPLLVDQPVVERRLEQASVRLVDRLVVDMRRDAVLQMASAPWRAFDALPAVVGHADAPAVPLAIDDVLVPQLASESTSKADLVAFLAAISQPGPPVAERLDVAARIADARVVTVPVGDQSALYAALRAR